MWAEKARKFDELDKKTKSIKPNKVKATRKVIGKRTKPATKVANSDNLSTYEEGGVSGQNGYMSKTDNDLLNSYFNNK